MVVPRTPALASARTIISSSSGLGIPLGSAVPTAAGAADATRLADAAVPAGASQEITATSAADRMTRRSDTLTSSIQTQTDLGSRRLRANYRLPAQGSARNSQ